MAEALCGLPEDPGQADQGQGAGGEDQERRGVQKLRDHHSDRPMIVENIMNYCEVARARGVSQMGITEHDRYLEEIDLAAFQEARELSHDVELRLGIEIDYVPGAEERMDIDATALPYDYVIGSVHRVDNEEVDR